MIVDAHQHYWAARPEFPWVAGRHAPADLAGSLHAAGVDATVLVQSVDSAAENARLAQYARATRTVAGVVAVPPGDGVPRLVGVRSLDGLVLPDGDLALDVVPTTRAQRRGVCEVADQRPQLRIVVDHLARPPLDGGDWGEWEADLRALAARPNVALKVSVGVAALERWEWDARALARPVEVALACFGPERLMLASNWPVVELRASYVRAWEDLAAACGVDRLVLGETAARWYRLQT